MLNRNWSVALLVLVFLLTGILILFDQYVRIGMWFQIVDIHHESFALSFFALAIGTLIGSYLPRKRADLTVEFPTFEFTEFRERPKDNGRK